MRDHFLRVPVLLLALAALAAAAATTGCTSHLSYRQAEIAAQKGDWDKAVIEYLRALDEDPENITYRAALLRAKIQASRGHFEKGQEYRKAGVLERALIEFQQAAQLDPTNQYAQAELESTRRAYQAQRQNREAASIQQMKDKARGARPQPPLLNPRSDQPISLEFPEEVSIFDIYRALGKAFGINVLFDPNLKDQNIAIELKEVTAKEALEILMRAAGHFYKVVDEQTVLIAADTPQNRRTYEDLVIQTFFLSNAEVKDMTTILRSLIDAKKIATNEQLNAIILRDTADKVKVAERIIEANDKSKAEVVIDVELLQINTGRLRDLGFSLTSYSIGQGLDLGNAPAAGGGTGGGTGSSGTRVRVSDLEFLNQSNWILTIPSFVYDFVKTNSDAQLLAKPQLRITDGEKANLTIGDRVPIPLTTFNTQNVGGAGGIVPITSFQYQDVGIRIDLEPRVHHNQEVTLKVKVEVSNLGGSIAGSGGQEQPIIGTRTIDSTIRLKDGETNFMAGLIRTDETASESGIPGLSDIPIIGRLFSNKNTNNQRTDVILTLTPHIIRNAEITEEDLLPIWVGTEANISFRGGSPRVESDVEGPFEGGEGTPEEIQDAIRRRIQRLPRGLRPGEGEGIEEEVPPEDQPQVPQGVDLVPSRPPTDIFREPVPVEPPPAEGAEPPPPGEPGENDLSSLGGGAAVPEPAVPAAAASTATTDGLSQLALASSRVAARASDEPSVRLRLTPETLRVSPGDRFELRLEIDALDPVSHVPLTVGYDARVLVAEKVEAGGFLGGAGESQVLADLSHTGRIVLGASRVGQVPGVTGSGLVARITFRAQAAGFGRVELQGVKALGPQLQPLAPQVEGATNVEVAGKFVPPNKPVLPPRPSGQREAGSSPRG
jgi:general secretion pathway protein D